MVCTSCQIWNPDWVLACVACATPLSSEESITKTTPPSSSDQAGAAPPMSQKMIMDRYEVQALLGRGGMGTVYKALDHKHDRPIALKIIRPELARKSDVLHRFHREFSVAREIRHPNVVRLYHLGTADGLKFMSMQYIEGETLNALRKQRKFPPQEAALVVRQISEGLSAVHAKHVVHRDLNTRNVMMDARGKAIIMDFGVACALDLPALTRPGETMGTTEYMSPEQVFGEKVDNRSDLFSLGLILYELLTGERLHRAGTTISELVKIFRGGTGAAIEWTPTVPSGLRQVVHKCLQVDRNVRYQSAEAVMQDLDDWLGRLPV